MPSVALALSGGVDSALSAYLLKQQGCKVTAVFWQLLDQKNADINSNTVHKNQQDAYQIAQQLDIPFIILDLNKQFKKNVIDYFIASYNQGISPNPCVRCNQTIKFGFFYDWAEKNNFDYIATGHYALITKNSSQTLFNKSEYLLTSSKNQHKDQTYFLYQLKSTQLSRLIFPIGNLSKEQVRQEAKKQRIHVAEKDNSADICFLNGQKIQNYLKQHITEQIGDITDQHGNLIGKHYGLWQYTLGQRQGFYINTKLLTKTKLLEDKHNPPALYVIGKNFNKNQLIVGDKQATLKSIILLNKIHWIYSDLQLNKLTDYLYAKIRHPGTKIACKLSQTKKMFKVEFQESVFGLAPGQSIVFYYKLSPNNYVCLGGGIIE